MIGKRISRAGDGVMSTWLQQVKETNAQLDRQFVHFIERHSDLFIALATSILLVWALVAGQLLYVAAILVVGAVSFFVGFIESVTVALLVIGGIALRQLPLAQGLDVSSLMMEAFGFGCVSWLGYRHREEQRLQKERAKTPPHAASVIPWVVTNEVRTSLAAVRFLLFPFQESKPTGELTMTTLPIAKAADELQRIENLFLEYERAQCTDGTQRFDSESSSGRI